MNIELPAQDLEAEKSLIASLIMNNNLFDLAEGLRSDDFYPSSHQAIFGTMLAMRSRSEKIDAGSLWFEMKKNGTDDKIPGPDYFIDLLENSPLFNTEKYVSIISECSITLQIKIACMTTMDSHLIGQDLLSLAQSSMLDVKTMSRDDDIKNLKDIIQSHIDRIEDANSTEAGLYYKLGFPRIDNCLKTIGPKLIIIAGRPGMGKTSFALTAAKNLDRERVKPGILSIEMPEQEIVDRLLSMESGVDSSKFGKFKGLNPKDFQKITDAASVFYECGISIDGSGGLDIVDVERKCRKMKKDGVQVIFIDQLSHIGNKEVKGGEATTRFAENTTRLSALKKELGIPIFLLAQLNRDLKNRANKEPILSLAVYGN